MEVGGATTSGDGTIANVGVKIAGHFRCPDCRQQFDSERAKQVHWKFSHNSGRDWEVGHSSGRDREEAAQPAQVPEEVECAICLDAVEVRAALPCRCRVPYCDHCWERALAHSLRDVGQARCPSCRGPVQVDFRADVAEGQGRLVFSRGAQDGQAVRRLAQKLAPVQVRLLQRFGALRPSLRDIAREPGQAPSSRPASELTRVLEAMGRSAVGDIGKAEPESSSTSVAGGRSSLVACWASPREMGPECICGGTLTRVGAQHCVRRTVKLIRPDIADDLSEDFYVQKLGVLTGGVYCVCDLCGKDQAQLDCAIWTCSKGRATVLHPWEYDVCEACVMQHVVDGSPTASSSQHTGS